MRTVLTDKGLETQLSDQECSDIAVKIDYSTAARLGALMDTERERMERAHAKEIRDLKSAHEKSDATRVPRDIVDRERAESARLKKELRDMLDTERTAVRSLSDCVNRANHEVDPDDSLSIDKFDPLPERVAMLRKRRAVVKAENERLGREINESTQLAAGLRGDIAELRQELATVRRMHASRVAGLEAALEGERSSNWSLRNKLDEQGVAANYVHIALNDAGAPDSPKSNTYDRISDRVKMLTAAKRLNEADPLGTAHAELDALGVPKDGGLLDRLGKVASVTLKGLAVRPYAYGGEMFFSGGLGRGRSVLKCNCGTCEAARLLNGERP